VRWSKALAAVPPKYPGDRISEQDIENISENLVFNICTSMSFSVLKRVADAIGSEKLADTFSEIEKSHPYNSVHIAYTGIKLDHYSGFPMQELESLHKVNEKNPLAFAVIQNFLLSHMYMYDVGFEKRQYLCQKFKIRMADQLVISNTSPIKKEMKTLPSSETTPN
jgi:hypothetical protein